MRIVSLELENYRRFRRVHLDLPDGVVGLVGRNGAGKSTLVEAVAWALYGHDAARTTKDLLVRRGAPPGEDCRVVLRFVLGEHRYEVVRELRGAQLSPEARLTVDGKAHVSGGAGSMDEVTGAVTRLLGMDRESFFTSLVARQKELNALSDMRPGERKDVVMRMLGIDAVDEAIRRCRREKRELRAGLDALQERLEELPRVEKEVEDARRSLQETKEAAAEAAKAAEAAREEAEALRDQVAELGEARERHRDLRRELASIRERLEALEEDLDARRRELDALDEARGDLQELEPKDRAHAAVRSRLQAMAAHRDRHRRHRELEQRREDLHRRVQDLASRREELERDLRRGRAARKLRERVRTSLQKVREEVSELDRRRTRLDAELQRHLDEAAEAWDHRAELLDLGEGTPCPTCERPLDTAHLDAVVREAEDDLARHTDHLEQGAHQAEELRSAHGDIRSKVQDLRERDEELDRKVREADRLEGTLETVTEDLETARGHLDDVSSALEELGPVAFDPEVFQELEERAEALAPAHERVLALRARLARHGEVRDEVARLQEEVATREATVEEMEEDLEALGFDPERFGKVREEAEAARDDAHERDKTRVAAKAQVERAADRLERAEADLERLEGLEGKVEAKREDLRVLERLAGDRATGLLVDFKVHLISRIRPLLGHRASELLRDLTDGRYGGLELDEDYNLLVHDQGESFHLARFSGGESDLANLCLRLAVGQLIAERAGDTDLGFLALDEVFGSQDAVRRGNILQALAGLAGRFRQILVITHVEEVRERVDHVLRVVEDEDGTAHVEVEGG